MTQEPITTIPVRPQSKSNFKVSRDQDYQIIAAGDSHKDKVKIILEYTLNDNSIYRVENSNDSPITIEIYNN